MSMSTLQRAVEDRRNLIRQNLKQDLAPADAARPAAPTLWEAVIAKRLLSTLPLPLELIDSIMDYAEYWPCNSTTMKDSVALLSDEQAVITDFYSIMFGYHHWVPEAVRDLVLVRTEPLPFRDPPAGKVTKTSWANRGLRNLKLRAQKPKRSGFALLPTRGHRPFRKVVFSIVSREDSRDSHAEMPSSWFEAILKKPEHSQIPQSPGTIPEDLAGPSTSRDVALAIKNTARRPSDVATKSFRSIWQTPSVMAERLTRRGSTPKDSIDDTSTASHKSTMITQNDLNSKLNKHHVVTWRYDGDVGSGFPDGGGDNEAIHIFSGTTFVRSMEVGDSILLCARNRSPSVQCMNYVARASVHIYWAV